ncbi:hypothetical protein SELMODRAFT_419738 [Selaginella moellendorffii]|uniref:Uncharacterized protein n=1 Tax=Selaginella moellendorffii TaxID=88036 RepID=D8S9W2_SELML|nr:uncharacterized protein LOC9646868 [Selaginella moellendorffii]EFJ19022.1 hypothetical protein SELMODRAFT_419738 [Selaginella moellendorffii]|eukprot:XP_002980152.1 uncharacterized protein LOC9646868 [Selaginella moellendorffii]
MVFHLYDSRAAAWISSTELTPVQEDEDLVCGVRMNCINYSNNCMLLQNDHLYFLTVSPGNVRRLKSFNVWNPKATLRTLATWNNLPLGFERQPWYEVDMSLISSGGKIVIGMLETHDRNTEVRTLRVCFVYLDEESCSWRAMASLSLGTVKIPELIKKPGRIFMVAAGNEHTTEVTLLFHYRWSCIFDLASGTLRSSRISKKQMPAFVRFIMIFTRQFVSSIIT